MSLREQVQPTDLGPRRLLTELAIGTGWVVLFVTLFYSVGVETGTGSVPRHLFLFQLPELLASALSSGPDSRWANLLQRLDIVGIAAVVLWGAAGWGGLLLRLINVRLSLSTPERLAVLMGVGLSIWSLLTLLHGVIGLLLRPLFLLFLIPAAIDLFRRFSRVKQTRAATKPPVTPKGSQGTKSPGVMWILVPLAGPFVLAMFLGAMLPSVDFDVKEYHLGGPKEYFLQGRVGFLEHNIYTSFPFLTEMLSLSTMVLRGDWFRGALAGKLVLMTFAPITAIGLFGLARRLWSTTAAVIGVVVFLTTPWVYRISTIAYTEGGMSAYLMLTVISFLWWLDCIRSSPQGGETEDSSSGLLLLTGVLAGSAAACKYPGVLSVVIPFGLAVLWVKRNSGLRSLVQVGIIYSVGVLVAFGPWLLKNLFETGNPVYPLVWSVFGGRGLDAAAHAKWQAGHPLPTHLWTQPVALIVDLSHQTWSVLAGSLWQSPLPFALAPMSFLLLRRRRAVMGLLLLFVWLLLTWCWLTHRIDRFWVPMLPIVCLLAGAGGGWLASSFAALRIDFGMSRDGKPTWPRLVSLWLMIALALPLFVSIWFNLFVVTSGLSGYNQYLLDEAIARRECAEPSIRLLDSMQLTDADKVLFVGDAALFEATFPYAYHSVFNQSIFQDLFADDAALPTDSTPSPGTGLIVLNDTTAAELPLRSDVEIQRRLRESGITVICANWNEILRYRHPGSYGYSGFVTPGRFQELVNRGHLSPIPMPQAYVSRPWDSLQDSEQKEILDWGPELRDHTLGRDVFITRQFYRVVLQ
ncbi:MAG: hypothetical protein R3C01_08485 [Planctomycetaceae bacterium]